MFLQKYITELEHKDAFSATVITHMHFVYKIIAVTAYKNINTYTVVLWFTQNYKIHFTALP